MLDFITLLICIFVFPLAIGWWYDSWAETRVQRQMETVARLKARSK